MPNGELIERRFSFGNGPCQFIALNAGVSNNPNSILLYDMMRRNVSLIDTDTIPLKINTQYQLPLDKDGLANPYTFISQINDSVFLMKMDSANESSWQMADLKKSKIRWTVENSHRDIEKSYTPYDFMQSVSDSTVLIAYKYIDLIEFYHLSDNGMIYSNSYGKTSDQSDLEDYNFLSYYYLSVACDNKYFYCLHSSNGDEFGNEIELYDISSQKPVSRYILDKNVNSISYHNGRIVGYAPLDNECIFYVWQI